MRYCFTKEQIEQALDSLFEDNEIEENLSIILNNAKEWSNKVVLINYLTAQIIQRGKNKGNLHPNFIQKLYALEDIGDLVVDEIDRDFIEFIYNHLSVSSDMSSNLIHYKEKQINYDYREQIRY